MQRLDSTLNRFRDAINAQADIGNLILAVPNATLEDDPVTGIAVEGQLTHYQVKCAVAPARDPRQDQSAGVDTSRQFFKGRILKSELEGFSPEFLEFEGTFNTGLTWRKVRFFSIDPTHQRNSVSTAVRSAHIGAAIAGYVQYQEGQ